MGGRFGTYQGTEEISKHSEENASQACHREEVTTMWEEGSQASMTPGMASAENRRRGWGQCCTQIDLEINTRAHTCNCISVCV